MGTIYFNTYASLKQLNVTNNNGGNDDDDDDDDGGGDDGDDGDDDNDDDDGDDDKTMIVIVLPSIVKLVRNVASQFSCHLYDLSLQYSIDIYRK